MAALSLKLIAWDRGPAVCVTYMHSFCKYLAEGALTCQCHTLVLCQLIWLCQALQHRWTERTWP